jgi:hypothetical protein
MMRGGDAATQRAHALGFTLMDPAIPFIVHSRESGNPGLQHTSVALGTCFRRDDDRMSSDSEDEES